MKVHRGLGIEARLRDVAFAPATSLNRDAVTGAVTNEHPLGGAAEARYGAPYLTLHRADLHAALADVVPADRVHRGKTLVRIAEEGGKVALGFADGSEVLADAAIGADGVHSLARAHVGCADRARFTGRVAYRTTFPATLLDGADVGVSRTKWWGADRHMVVYPVTAARDEVYFVTSQPERADWITAESWSAKGDVNELRKAYAGFHSEVRMVLDACPDCHKWAILERDPLPSWSRGRVVLIGDACHPMTPYMAQGAATSIEDAAVLARCLKDVSIEGIESAFKRFEAHRKPRTSRIQEISSANTWMSGGNDDPAWLYGYDAWNVSLDEPAPTPGSSEKSAAA